MNDPNDFTKVSTVDPLSEDERLQAIFDREWELDFGRSERFDAATRLDEIDALIAKGDRNEL